MEVYVVIKNEWMGEPKKIDCVFVQEKNADEYIEKKNKKAQGANKYEKKTIQTKDEVWCANIPLRSFFRE